MSHPATSPIYVKSATWYMNDQPLVIGLEDATRADRNRIELVTFGSPVDLHRTLRISTDITERVVAALRTAIEPALERTRGLPGILTSTGFRVLSARKELGQLVDFVRKLHDRDALIKRESRRRFLAGEGFVAWPGPALRTFIDESARAFPSVFVSAGRRGLEVELAAAVLAEHTHASFAVIGRG